MTTERYIKLGRQIALISFLLGTLIFVVYFLTSLLEILFVGYAFMVLAGLLNIGILVEILVMASVDKKNWKKLFMTSWLMLVNIPVMLVYCWVAIVLMNTMRITFTNEIGAEITDVKIVGCGGGYINKLEKGESKIVWIKIAGDCSIHIDYLLNGKRQGETVAGYVTSSGGDKINHKINGATIEMFRY